MKIAVTGGHLTPALAVIEELKKILGLTIIYIGRANSAEGDKSPSAESVVIPNLGLKFYAISTGRLQRRFSIHTIPSIGRIPFGMVQSLAILAKERPNIIVSFGSYVAFPVVLAGWVLGIPSISHEQTISSGLANKMIAPFAKKIALAWEESKKNFPEGKAVVVGNPIRKEILNMKKIRSTRPVIFITGGNQGAHVINDAVSGVLNELLEEYEIIHQTGGSEVYKDYERLKSSVSQLPKRLRNRYKVSKWLNTNELVKVLARTSLIVGRSGANTVSEVAALKIPAIFIPIPWSAGNEQTMNAKVLQGTGAAVILPEDRLTPKRLLNTIDHIIKNYVSFKEKARKSKTAINKNAARDFVVEIKKLVSDDIW